MNWYHLGDSKEKANLYYEKNKEENKKYIWNYHRNHLEDENEKEKNMGNIGT